jgi:heat shock protein HtpX
VQHMLLVADEGGAVAHWLDAHPPLEQRIRRLYGRAMPPLPLQRQDEPSPASPAAGGAGAPGKVPAGG